MAALSLFLTIASFVLVADITIVQGAVCTGGIPNANGVVGPGGSHTMSDRANYLANTYLGAGNWDPCKFEILFVARRDPNGPRGSKRLEWMSVAFGVHQNDPSRYERMFEVSRTQGTVKLKGRAIRTTVVTDGCYATGAGPTPWEFCLHTDHSGCWVIEFGEFGIGCVGSVTYCETGMGDNISDHDQVTMSIGPYYDGLLKGMCGNINGPPDCSNVPNVHPLTCVVN